MSHGFVHLNSNLSTLKLEYFSDEAVLNLTQDIWKWLARAAFLISLVVRKPNIKTSSFIN